MTQQPRVPGRPDIQCAAAMPGRRWCRLPREHDGRCAPNRLTREQMLAARALEVANP